MGLNFNRDIRNSQLPYTKIQTKKHSISNCAAKRTTTKNSKLLLKNIKFLESIGLKIKNK